jgi:hypothetical protein
MDDRLKFYGRVASNKFVPYKIEKLNNYIRTLNGKEVEFSIGPKKSIRSIRQNSYYWNYIKTIVEECDGVVTKDRMDSMHEFLKRQLLDAVQDKVRLPGGKIVEFTRPESTTNMDKADFSAYIKKIEIFTGIPMPEGIS